MATITASAAGGASNTNGAWVGGVQPTSADDVIFASTSGNITIPSATTLACRSLDCTATGNYAGVLTFAATTSVLSIGDASGGKCKFVNTMTLTLTGLGTINFLASTASTIYQLTTAGLTMPNLTVNTGTTTTIQCADAVTATGATVTLTQGKLDRQNFAFTCGSFSSTVGNTRTLTLGSTAAITCTAAGGWNCSAGTGLTVTANTAVITCSGASATLGLGSINWNGTSFILSGSGAPSLNSGAGGTIANLTRTGTAAKTDGLTFGLAGPTITGTLTLGGNTTQGTNRLLVGSGVVGTQRSFVCTAAAVVINGDVDFMDIAITGSPSWTNSGSAYVGDCGGNSGITFTAAQPQYRIGAGGNWSDATKWSQSSGGANNGRVPLPQDNVTLDSGASGTVAADMPRFAADVTATTFAGVFSRSLNGLTSFGSWTNSSSMTMAGTVTQVFAGRGTHTVTSGGLAFANNGGVTFQGPGGTYTLQDALNVAGVLTLNDGTFASGNFTITATTFLAQSGRTQTVNLGTSTVNLSGTSGTVWGTSATAATYSTASATIVLTAASTSSRTLATATAAAQTLGTVTYTVANSPGTLLIQPSSTGGAGIGTLNVGPGRGLQFFLSRTVNIGTWNVNGVNNGYQRLPGVAANYASAPDSAALSVTGDIDIRVKVALDDWTPATEQFLLAKYDTAGNQRSYALSVQTGSVGTLKLVTSNAGTATSATAVSTVAPTVADGATLWVRVTRASGTGNVNFYTSTDATNDPTAVTWTQLGVQVAATSGTIFDGTAPVEIGSVSLGTSTLAVGNFYVAAVLNGIAGTVAFRADFTAKTVGANTFTESSTNAATVTINGTLAQAGDGRVALTSSTAGTQATINYTGTGVVNSDYLTIQDSNATPGSTWYAGHNSTSVSGNSGWIFGATGFSASVSDTALATDTVVRSAIFYTRTANITATASDIANRIVAAARSATDTVVATDVLVSNLRDPRTAADIALAADAATRASFTFQRIVADTQTATDTARGVVAITRASTDTANATDLVTRLAAIGGLVTDAATAIDIASAVLVLQRAVADDAFAADQAVRLFALLRTATAAATAIDTVIRAFTIARSAAELATLAESATAYAAHSRSMADVALATETTARLATFARVIAEMALLAESANRGIVVQISEHATLIEVAVGIAVYTRAVMDYALAVDSITGVRRVISVKMSSSTAAVGAIGSATAQVGKIVVTDRAVAEVN